MSHTDSMIGHIGKQKLIDRISQECYVIGLEKIVKQVESECGRRIETSKMREKSGKEHIQPMPTSKYMFNM